MSIELPVLRLGLAGFNTQQQEAAKAIVEAAVPVLATWEISPLLPEADAWWMNGSRTHFMPDGTLRVNPGTPTARSLHLDLREVDRPIAFAHPLPPGPLGTVRAFNLGKPDEAGQVLDLFTAWLRPMLAQFGLASSIVDNHGALGAGAFQVLHGTTLVAVVNMRGDVGVLPTATVTDFDETIWRRCPPEMGIPEHFAKMSLSQLMWHFAMRTQRELLPPHYRTGLIYFRRAPRLPQRLLSDTHLLLLRELAAGCATLEELHVRSGLPQGRLGQDLAALYMVGAITSNPKRAAHGATRRLEAGDSIMTSGPSSIQPETRPALTAADMTAPVVLRPS